MRFNPYPFLSFTSADSITTRLAVGWTIILLQGNLIDMRVPSLAHGENSKELVVRHLCCEGDLLGCLRQRLL